MKLPSKKQIGLGFGWMVLVGLLTLIYGGFLSLHGAGCRSPVSVNVKNEMWKCESTTTNSDGSINHNKCQRDGAEPVNQETDGEAPGPIEGRLNPPPAQLALTN